MTIAIHCGQLIDGSGAGPIRNATIVIEGDTITAVNPGGEIPRGAEVIDASGLTVMPGMIDCHVHLMSTPRSLQDRLLIPHSLAVAEALTNARTTLEAGFTSVRDAGGTPRGVKMAIDRGLFPGPRMRIAVAALSQTGGHGDSTMPSGVNVRVTDPERPLSVADGVEGVRRATREILRAGADQVKVMTSGGVMSPNDEPGATGFTPEEIAAIVYEAHAAGKTVMSHAQATGGIKNAVLGGIESIEHGIYLDDEVIGEMIRRGTFLVATLVAPAWVIRRAEADPAAVPPYALRKSREVKDAHFASFQEAVRRGVRIAMGTDMGVGPHGPNAEELALMVEAGMTPMQAIVAATGTAAECARLDTITGTLAPGKRADIIAVDGDPLLDIAVLQERARLALIMKDGQCHKNSLGSRALAPA
ncbi:MAG: amidohydrolase family protein [Dehalococcoidia bacterium]|nr:amidohydrolase family protein [Dehalococcoidia bacterium]MCL4232842.1 amidohydrolase family protein [Dehalococcoidia bacterium]NUQ55020.1 amidohydrolase family protein [Dehalococcoidia bacterium]